MSNDVTKFADAINKSWRKTTDNVLETAKLCADADARLETKEKKKLIKDLDFNDSTFSKLVTIGSRAQLQTAREVTASGELFDCLSTGDLSRNRGRAGGRRRNSKSEHDARAA